MKFAVGDFADLILSCNPDQVNIGADSGRNGLPEPTREDLEKLIGILRWHTEVHLNRLTA